MIYRKFIDKVSCFLLLKTLVKMGIGTFMLESLKSLYSTTCCILKCFGKVSHVFQTYTGIKQGASSSVILFIAFMDEVIDVLKERCIDEPVIHNLHCLLHADDTLVLSTDKDLFINKCNILIDSFQKKKTSINVGKSGYMIINAGENILKTDQKLSFGWLSYKNHQKYLGVIICDTGKLIDEMNLFAKDKRKEIIIKLANFIYNKFAPVMVKLKLVKSCVNASITYPGESWGSCSVMSLEVLQRKALK